MWSLYHKQFHEYVNLLERLKFFIHNSSSKVLLVEPRGIEPLSESNLEGTSPGAVCYLHSLIPAGTNTLRNLVAS